MTVFRFLIRFSQDVLVGPLAPLWRPWACSHWTIKLHPISDPSSTDLFIHIYQKLLALPPTLVAALLFAGDILTGDLLTGDRLSAPLLAAAQRLITTSKATHEIRSLVAIPNLPRTVTSIISSAKGCDKYSFFSIVDFQSTKRSGSLNPVVCDACPKCIPLRLLRNDWHRVTGYSLPPMTSAQPKDT